jgi:hypothetical protein
MEPVRDIPTGDESVEVGGRGVIIALPETVEDLMSNLKSKKNQTLNDQVQSLHLILWPKSEYKAYLDAVWKENAVEGDLFVDDIMACEMIRTQAVKSGNAYVANQPLAAIRKALLVVMRRFQISRRERREGEYVGPSINL